jgi:hypothetical protein
VDMNHLKRVVLSLGAGAAAAQENSR